MQRRYDNICPRCGKRPRTRKDGGYCRPCSTKHTAEWRAKNLERKRANDREWNRKKKYQIFKRYGGKCACCGESNFAFLTIDHINGRGNEERRKYHSQTWKLVIKHGYPKTYQLLCYNCNNAKSNFGTCPHQRPTSVLAYRGIPVSAVQPSGEKKRS
jgi:hypothetical protein